MSGPPSLEHLVLEYLWQHCDNVESFEGVPVFLLKRLQELAQAGHAGRAWDDYRATIFYKALIQASLEPITIDLRNAFAITSAGLKQVLRKANPRVLDVSGCFNIKARTIAAFANQREALCRENGRPFHLEEIAVSWTIKVDMIVKWLLKLPMGCAFVRRLELAAPSPSDDMTTEDVRRLLQKCCSLEVLDLSLLTWDGSVRRGVLESAFNDIHLYCPLLQELRLRNQGRIKEWLYLRVSLLRHLRVLDIRGCSPRSGPLVQGISCGLRLSELYCSRLDAPLTAALGVHMGPCLRVLHVEDSISPEADTRALLRRCLELEHLHEPADAPSLGLAAGAAMLIPTAQLRSYRGSALTDLGSIASMPSLERLTLVKGPRPQAPCDDLAVSCEHLSLTDLPVAVVGPLVQSLCERPSAPGELESLRLCRQDIYAGSFVNALNDHLAVRSYLVIESCYFLKERQLHAILARSTSLRVLVLDDLPALPVRSFTAAVFSQRHLVYFSLRGWRLLGPAIVEAHKGQAPPPCGSNSIHFDFQNCAVAGGYEEAFVLLLQAFPNTMSINAKGLTGNPHEVPPKLTLLDWQYTVLRRSFVGEPP